jgi:hypothetical protein
LTPRDIGSVGRIRHRDSGQRCDARQKQTLHLETSVTLLTHPRIDAGKLFRNAFASGAQKSHSRTSFELYFQTLNDETTHCCRELIRANQNQGERILKDKNSRGTITCNV